MGLCQSKGFFLYHSYNPSIHHCREFVVAQSVEHATPGVAVMGSIPAVAARSLLVGLVSVCDRLRQKSWSHHSVSCGAAGKIVRRQSLDSSTR